MNAIPLRRNHFAVGLLVGLTGLVSVAGAKGEEEVVASLAHIHALQRAEECGAFRKIEREAQLTMGMSERAIREQMALSLLRRANILECAKRGGITSVQNARDEVLAAELCPQAYESWLSPGYRVQMLRQDALEAAEMLQQARQHLRLHCGSMPTQIPEAESPPKVF